MMYSQGLNMSPDKVMGTQQGRSSKGMNAFSGSKMKHEGQIAKTVDIIWYTMEFVNNQLKVIVEWSKEQRQAKDEYDAKCVKQLQDISELTSRDRVRLMWIVMRSVQGMKSFLRIPSELKLEYCTVLLEDNA